MAAEKKKQKKRVFDIAKPGKTPATASARPIIVTHEPIVEDPMVSKNQSPSNNSDEEDTRAAMVTKAVDEPMSHGEKVLEPLHENVAKESKKADSALDSTKEIVQEQAIPEEPLKREDNPEEKAEEETDPEEVPGNSTTTDINAADDELNEKKANQLAADNEGKEEAERQEKVAKLIEEKQYFVKLGEARHGRKSTSTAVILLLLLLVVVGLYLAVDAGVIDTNLELPYEFIKQ